MYNKGNTYSIPSTTLYGYFDVELFCVPRPGRSTCLEEVMNGYQLAFICLQARASKQVLMLPIFNNDKNYWSYRSHFYIFFPCWPSLGKHLFDAIYGLYFSHQYINITNYIFHDIGIIYRQSPVKSPDIKTL